ncbi:FAD-dependent oxidoreductase [Siccirubricoccus sp. G192]|uniref:FAD-binding oxidoreductase n=1 Tax=Siccirubricoccus sp. G192 TaxID=2849651 RepID=UPI001C2C5A4D|nr:FAD-dependent oxidoreductase [Siccirubricoccus sp. G192]
MNATSSLADTAAELARSFMGQVLRPGDPGYEDARKVHNGLIDKRPALIARCGGLADIVDAVKLARDQGLEVAVRGGGHNVAGRATTEGGLMLDLSLMQGIHVDPRARTARAQGGVTWNGFNRETQLHGLATTGGRGLLDGHRGPDARRRARLAHGQACAGPRQPPVGGGRPGRWQGRHGERRGQYRPLLGPARRRRQFRRGGVLRIPPARGGAHGHRGGSSPIPSARPGTCCGTSGMSRRRCPTSSPSSAAWSTRRTGRARSWRCS